MERLALGVAALLVVTAGSVATATPNRRDTWCEKHSDAQPPPEVGRERPASAGGGSRDGRVKNAFACYDASAQAADREVRTSAVVNAWADHERGALSLNCVQAGAPACNQTITLPAKVQASTPGWTTVLAPSSDTPARVSANDPPEPLVAVEVAGRTVTVDGAGSPCVEVDRSPLCGENPGGG